MGESHQPLCPECEFGGLPLHIAPMLASDARSPAGSDWAYEFKWDGVRALCYWAGGEMRLESRNLNTITSRYPELLATGEQVEQQRLILDGEIVALDADGHPSFQRLQQRMHLSPSRARQRRKRLPVYYYVFDLLWCQGRSLMDDPYAQRREQLEALQLTHPNWRIPPSHVNAAEDMLDVARRWELEGLVAKRLDGLYRPGQRSRDWVKIKIVPRQEFVIGGWEPRKQNSEQIGSLLVGYYDPGHVGLRLAGRVGTGFDAATHERLLSLLRKRQRDDSPFADRVDGRDAHFVRPELVAEIDYRRWPEGGSLQQASYRGLRDDKPAHDVVLERG
jgi:bifunctional non-homologous end joining protein LigD